MTVSRECQAIVDYVESTGLLYRVTDITGPGHDPDGFHYAAGTGAVGLAVDFGGAVPGVTAVTAVQMGAVYRALLQVGAQLAELIYNGAAGGIAIHNGRRVDGAAFYGAEVWADHRDHVHVAVPRGVFLTPLPRPLGGTMPADDPNRPNVNAPCVGAMAAYDAAGNIKGYILVGADYGLFTYGEGVRVLGAPPEYLVPDGRHWTPA